MKQNNVKIDLQEDAVYRVKNGQLEKLDSPVTGFGEVIVKWQDGKPGRYEVRYTK